MRALFLSVGLLALALPVRGEAQSLERQIERLAQSIAANAERIAANVERHATRLAERIEREFADKRDQRYGAWDRDDQPARSRIDTTYAFAADGVVDLMIVSGDIIVRGWERREARVQAYSERGRLESEFSSSRLTIDVRSDRDNWGRGRYGETRYEVSVPHGARLMLRSTSGDISVTDTRGEVEAKSSSGEITVEGARDRVEIGTISGDIIGRGLTGDIEAGTVSGEIDLSNVEGVVRLSSTSGELTLTDARSRDVEMSTTSGDISFDGTLHGGGRYEFSSHSGSVDLTVPATANARFSVETYSGEIDSEFPITLQPGSSSSRRPRRFDFTVGTGGPRVTAESFSGTIEIRKRR
jgi:DUF4097 and DUF4098 domain-containing protein YvlB